jgi:hypothetical protein
MGVEGGIELLRLLDAREVPQLLGRKQTTTS